MEAYKTTCIHDKGGHTMQTYQDFNIIMITKGKLS